MLSLATHVANRSRLEASDWSDYDVLYLGEPSCPLYPGNFGCHIEELAAGVEAVKSWGKRAVLSLYAVPRNEDLGWIRDFLKEAVERRIALDGVEVHNLGLLMLLRELGSPWPVTIGVCGNLYTTATAQLLRGYGARDGFPNPELGLADIELLAREGGLEVILQVHGKIPLGFSDKCFVVDYQKHKGSCEELCFSENYLTRDGWVLKNIGRVILSGKELCMIEHLPSLLEAGYKQFYISTFAEAPDYVTSCGRVYREALETAARNGARYHVKEAWVETIRQFAPVGLCNGFYFNQTGQTYVGSLEA